MPEPIENIHDKFIKELLLDKEMAIAFLRSTLPPDILSELSLDTLSIGNTTYLTPTLEELFSDLVFDIQLKNHEPVQVSLLLEHKSYIDPKVPVQVLRYLTEAYNKQSQQNEILKPVLPFVYYHGKNKWELRQLDKLFTKYPSVFRPYIPLYECLFVDLNKVSDEDLENIENSMLSAALFLQRDYHHPSRLLDNLERILSSLQPYYKDSRSTSLLIYLLSSQKVNRLDLSKKLITLPKALNQKIMSIYESLIQEGVEKGIEKGIKKGVEKGKDETLTIIIVNGFKNGLSVELLRTITGEPLARIEAILKENGLNN